ncbi:MAG TPA: hypothetical protein VFE45_11105, partial [Coriobacteriia bacterium]|nr:hypothetical protein [Coriobacteriia bacterium]
DMAPLPQLWARQAIRDLEEGADERSRHGSKQERGERDVTPRVVELSRRYGVISRSTSFLAIETREGEDRTREESVLRRVPVMLTRDWHGLGSVQGVGFAAAAGPSLARSLMADGGRHLAPMSFAAPTRRGRRARRAASADDSREATVLGLLALQRPEGGFAFSDELAKLVEVPLELLQDAADEVGAAGAADAEALVATAVVLRVLRTRFAAQTALWESLVRKSESWLAGELATAPVTVGGVPLKEWATRIVGG